MLFAKLNLDLQQILFWAVIAIAIGALGGVIFKCVVNYRALKRNKMYVKRDGEVVSLLAIRGEYFVMSKDVEYVVDSGGQLKQGDYVLKGDGYDNFTLTVNGEQRSIVGTEILQLSDGDKLVAVTCDLLIKPHTYAE